MGVLWSEAAFLSEAHLGFADLKNVETAAANVAHRQIRLAAEGVVFPAPWPDSNLL